MVKSIYTVDVGQSYRLGLHTLFCWLFILDLGGDVNNTHTCVLSVLSSCIAEAQKNWWFIQYSKLLQQTIHSYHWTNFTFVSLINININQHMCQNCIQKASCWTGTRPSVHLLVKSDQVSPLPALLRESSGCISHLFTSSAMDYNMASWFSFFSGSDSEPHRDSCCLGSEVWRALSCWDQHSLGSTIFPIQNGL